jgi:hypothetical protein
MSIPGITVEIGQSGKLLVNGLPFPGTARTFWNMRKDTCPIPLVKSTLLVINNVRYHTPRGKKQVYGIAIFSYARKENCWYHKYFIVGTDTIAIAKAKEYLLRIK